MEIGAAVAIGVGILGSVSVVTIAVANILYNKPHIEALEGQNKTQAGQISKLQSDAAAAAATLLEKERQIQLVADLVKSVPEYGRLAAATEKLTTHVGELGSLINRSRLEMETHARETTATGKAIVTALEAVTLRLERKSGHRSGDPT